MPNDIEKDIKTVEELVIKSRDLREEEFYKLIGIKQIQSISTVVSELSNLKWKNKIYAKSIKSHKELIENKDKELEIWKKIAERIAKLTCRIANYDDAVLGQKVKETIDWARKEVEKDE